MGSPCLTVSRSSMGGAQGKEQAAMEAEGSALMREYEGLKTGKPRLSVQQFRNSIRKEEPPIKERAVSTIQRSMKCFRIKTTSDSRISLNGKWKMEETEQAWARS